jgi:alkylation response protein AidB-like acyl-CoA dehydrogenase
VERWIYDDEHEQFRASLTAWVEAEVGPHYADWDRAGIVPREIWLDAGRQGFLCPDVSEALGGGGAPDWRFNAVLSEVFGRAGIPGLAFSLHSDVVVPYVTRFGTPEQQQRWLPGMARGEVITAIAMTEPGTGSDLAAIATTAKDAGDHFVVNGSKTFISNGHLADAVVVVARTEDAPGHGSLSLLVVERGMAGFERGRNLDKIGMHAQDTAELHFTDVRVPRENLLGERGRGFYHLMEGLAQERLVVAIGGLANAWAVLEQTAAYARERTAFGQPIGSFQVNRHAFAEMQTRLQIAQVFLDRSIELHCRGELTAVEAAMAKYALSDLQVEVIDRCLQMHGGYGYMEEYPVARAYRDARVQRIYAGTNEIMKELIGRSMGF